MSRAASATARVTHALVNVVRWECRVQQMQLQRGEQLATEHDPRLYPVTKACSFVSPTDPCWRLDCYYGFRLMPVKKMCMCACVRMYAHEIIHLHDIGTF